VTPFQGKVGTVGDQRKSARMFERIAWFGQTERPYGCAPRLKLGKPFAPPKEVPHPGKKRLIVEGSGNNIIRPCIKRLDPRRRIRVAGEDNHGDRRRRRIGPQAVQQINHRHIGHLWAQQD
jgi:hypothetical protein